MYYILRHQLLWFVIYYQDIYFIEHLKLAVCDDTVVSWSPEANSNMEDNLAALFLDLLVQQMLFLLHGRG